jgi:hypothetical protein
MLHPMIQKSAEMFTFSKIDFEFSRMIISVDYK